MTKSTCQNLHIYMYTYMHVCMYIYKNKYSLYGDQIMNKWHT